MEIKTNTQELDKQEAKRIKKNDIVRRKRQLQIAVLSLLKTVLRLIIVLITVVLIFFLLPMLTIMIGIIILIFT